MQDAAIRSQTRHLLISLALKRQKRGSGSSSQFLRERTSRIKYPDLTMPFSGVLWSVADAAATRLYMPERMTNDLDILIRSEDSGAVRGRLTASGASCKNELSLGGSSWVLADGFPLNVIEVDEGWVLEALTQAQANLGADGMPVLPLPYLILMKFQASRVQDVADISRMLGQATQEQLEAVKRIFSQWQSDGLEDLDSLIMLGQLEF